MPPSPPPPPRRAISTQSTRAGGCDVAQVSVLQQDKRWRFQWSEVSFIQLWWKDQNPATREAFKNLVVSGQLELTGGGLVMNDEALTTLFAIIENVNEGRRWIEENIGVTVDTSWQNDPFGLSATMSYLYGRMDYLGMWIQRVHYRVKAYLAHERSFEFWWRQHGDEAVDIDQLSFDLSILTLPQNHVLVELSVLLLFLSLAVVCCYQFAFYLKNSGLGLKMRQEHPKRIQG